MLARTRRQVETQMLCGDRVEFRPGDTLEFIENMEDDSVDSIVTVPPPLVSNQIWTEALRVLKPGHHFTAVSSPQNCSKLSYAIEDAAVPSLR
jgi:predicted methyltransferase